MAEILTRQQKRQAIARGLRQYLTAPALERELNYWEDAYGDKPTFVLNRFVNDICSTEHLRELRKEILRHVLYEMAEAEREAQHLPKLNSESMHVNANSHHLADAFDLFLKNVLQYVAAKDLADFNAEVQLQLEMEGFRLGSTAAGSKQLTDFLPMTRYSEFLTVVYQQFCEFYGPARADFVYVRGRELMKNTFPALDISELL